MEEVLTQVANIARDERQSENHGPILGYCYENAEATSKLLQQRGISHGLYYVGIIEDIIMASDWSREQLAEASRSGEYDLPPSITEGGELEFPSTREELPSQWNHWVVGVEVGETLYCVEPCAEARDRFRQAHASPWSHESYLLLENSKKYER